MNRLFKGAAPVSLALLLALGSLTACSGGGREEPATVAKEYAAAVNAGDVEKALSYVVPSNEVTASNTVIPEGTVVSEPLAKDNPEISTSAEAVTLLFDVAGVPTTFDFQKIDGHWKLTEGIWLNSLPEWGGDNETLPVTPSTASGQPLKDISYVITPEDELPITGVFDHSWFGEHEVKGVVDFLDIEPKAKFESLEDVRVTDVFYDYLQEETSKLLESKADQYSDEETITEFPKIDDCVFQNLSPAGTYVLCQGGSMKTVSIGAKSAMGDMIIEPGTEKTGRVRLRVTVLPVANEIEWDQTPWIFEG